MLIASDSYSRGVIAITRLYCTNNMRPAREKNGKRTGGRTETRMHCGPSLTSARRERRDAAGNCFQADPKFNGLLN